MGGLLGGLMAFDFAKAVIDNEIAMNLKHLRRGIPYGENDFCLDLINKLGPGGSYMDQPHTARNMRGVTHYPAIGFRGFRGKWLGEGRPAAAGQAAALARRILARPNPDAFAAELDRKVREHIPNLPAGDAVWYEGS
jgi:trimethylamine--corrinoid protein Co-methyltransferase